MSEEKHITPKKAVDALKTVVGYCKQVQMCQNCVFRGNNHGETWGCIITDKYLPFTDIEQAEFNLESKKKNHGYL